MTTTKPLPEPAATFDYTWGRDDSEALHMVAARTAVA